MDLWRNGLCGCCGRRVRLDGHFRCRRFLLSSFTRAMTFKVEASAHRGRTIVLGLGDIGIGDFLCLVEVSHIGGERCYQ